MVERRHDLVEVSHFRHVRKEIEEERGIDAKGTSGAG
jgi:hypothetical protein